MNQAGVFRHMRLAIDFDGTLFEDCGDVERSNREQIPLAPRPGAGEVTRWLKTQGFELLIFTCRPDYHRAYMQRLLAQHGIAHDYILFYTKPRVDLYIDDKGFRFESWDATRDWIARHLHEIGSLTVGSQQPESMFEAVLRKQKLAALELQGVACALDVGCGDGDVFRGSGLVGLTLDGVEPDSVLRARAAAGGMYRRLYSDLSEVSVASYDAILLLGVLEHVEDDAAFLDRLREAKEVHCSVPNAGSFHRRFGLHLGLIESLTELQAHDHAVGHRRYYTVEAFRSLLVGFGRRHGFEISRFGTCSFKLSSNSEMMRFADRIQALNRTVEELSLVGPDCPYGAEIYCTLKRTSPSR